jgi:uncharacterized protein
MSAPAAPGRAHRTTGMKTSTRQKASKLRDIMASLEGAVVAFSGGVDSSLLLAVARECLGSRIVAVTAASPLVPAGEVESARRFTEDAGIPHTIIHVDVLALPAVAANTPDRCYLCKRAIFSKIREFASSRGISHVVEGTHRDDEGDFRPGMRALAELGIASPLRDAGLTKAEIRELAREMGIAAWDRPAGPCLATRIPCGTFITLGAIERVRAAEEHLRGMGFREVRVRCHGDLARIEVPRDEISRFLDEETKEQAIRGVKGTGFAFVSLDLEGYRSGSMNRSTGAEKTDGQG